jgi:hypothetical protein
MGRGYIYWIGSAFNCPSTNNYILLSLYDIGTGRTCNNGAIVGRSISVEGNSYTSQLNITVTPDTAGMAIACLHQNWTHFIVIFSSITPTTTG